MSEAIIAAIIASVGSLIGVIITVRTSNNKIISEMHEHNVLQDERITQLTNEVHKHNDYAERLPILETRFQNVEERLNKIERRFES